MFTKNRAKKKRVEGHESFVIFKIGILAIIVNYAITQIALAINQDVSKIINIPFSNYFEPTIASTVSFSVLMIAIFALYYFTYSVRNKKNRGNKTIKSNFCIRRHNDISSSMHQHNEYNSIFHEYH